MTSFEFTLSFTKNQWICFNDDSKFIGNSLEEIDSQIASFIQLKKQKGTYNIKMFFDFERFPNWHRQYMSHYFNRDYNLTIQ